MKNLAAADIRTRTFSKLRRYNVDILLLYNQQ